MKDRVKRNKCIRAAVFCAGLLVFLAVAQRFMTPRTRDALSQTFYAGGEDHYDVLFCGNSLIMNGVYPLDMWHEAGIVGYNIGTGGQPLTMTAELVRDSIDRFHPQLIVLDTTQLIVPVANQKTSFLHYLTDNMPYFAGVRYRLIDDISGQMDYSIEERAGFLVPFYAYHSRWKELDKESFTGDTKKHTAGAKIQGKVIENYAEVPEVVPDPATELNPYPLRYLDEIIDLCAETGTDLLLVSVPLCAPARESYAVRVQTAYAAERYAEARGVPYYNLIDRAEEIGIDRARDTTDGFHLNKWGAEKYTAALTSYLKEHWDLPDRREEAHYAYLNARYDRYQKIKEAA